MPSDSFDATIQDEPSTRAPQRPPRAGCTRTGTSAACWHRRRRGGSAALADAWSTGRMAVLGPYFDKMQEYLGVNLRAIDAVAQASRRGSAAAELRIIGAVRADLIDFAYHVDERANG